MNLNLYIASRIKMSGTGGSSSPAVKVATISVALSIATMLLAVSIVQGFRSEIYRKVLGFNPHITLSSPEGLIPADTLLTLIGGEGGVVSATPGLSLPALLKTPAAFQGIYLRTLPNTPDSTFLPSSLTAGTLPRDEDQILISETMGRKLSVAPSDSIALYSIGRSIASRKVAVCGTYNSHFENYDSYLAFSSPALLASLAGLPDSASTFLEITTGSLEQAPEVAASLHNRLTKEILAGNLQQTFTLSTAQERSAGVFAWLDMLDTNVWVILILMSLVALFTLISGLLIVILEKVRFIGIMKALGASTTRLQKIFVLMAVRTAGRGILWGTLIALGLILLQGSTHVFSLDPDSYYIDYVPVSLSPLAFIGIEAAFILLSYIVLALPARLVSRISPAESMRFEQ